MVKAPAHSCPQILSIVASQGPGFTWSAAARAWPLAVAVTAANLNDSVVFEALLDDVPAVRTPSGRRRCRPSKVHADKGYDARHCRAYPRRRGITARIARRGVESSQRDGGLPLCVAGLRADLLQPVLEAYRSNS
jgi:hypothetical protein